jgi:outer membrane receptor protein involved in Fe transport
MRALAVAVLLAVPAAAVAQAADTLAGRVTDQVGQPIPTAIVEVTELGRSVTTAANGTYRLALPTGRYTVVIRRTGFAPVVRGVTVAGAVALDVALAPSPFQLEPVTVTATRSPVAADASPLPFSALSGDQLRRVRGVSLAHVLADLPGVRALTTGAQIGKPVIRGLSGSRILVLENGSRLEDYSWSDEDGPSVETGFVRRVEVIRGPASVLYGSDAVGGVVNVIAEPLPTADPGASAFMRTGFTLSAATNNLELGGAARAEGAKGALGWRVAGVGRYAGNIHTPAGELDNTGFGAANAEGAIGWHGDRGAVSLRVVHYGGEFKLLEANGPPDTLVTEEGGPERKASDERVQITAERRTGAWRLEAKGQVQRHSLIEVSDDTVPGGGGSATETEAFNLLLQTGSLDLLAHHASGSLRGTLGVSGVAQGNDASGRIPLVPDARIGSVAAFAFEQVALGRVSLLLGGRVDARHLTADADTALALGDQQRRYTAWSADAGLVWHVLPAMAVTANAGRAWRAPTLFELFAHGPHIGEARYEQGDSTLVPEVGRSVDLAVHWLGRRVRFELAGYENHLAHYIYITPTAQFVDTLRVYQRVQADAELVGVEASVEAQPVEPLLLRARLDGVRGSNLAAHEPLPLVPPVRVAVGLGWKDLVELDVESYARQTRLNPLDVPTPGYTLVHVSAGRAVHLFGHAMRVDLALRNALNTHYRDFLSRYKEFALDPGRNLIIRLSAGDVE